MNVIVVGGGKVGYYLAETLLEHGHKPFVIETDKEICRKIFRLSTATAPPWEPWKAPAWNIAMPLSALPDRIRSI